MKLALVTILILATLAALTPSASAHQCSGSAPDCVCPIPDDGKYHQHAGPSGACQGGPGGQQNAGAGGASQSVPGLAVVAVVAAGVVAALARRT